MLGAHLTEAAALRLVEFVGPPEAGKSTLVMSLLSRREADGPARIDARLLARRLRGTERSAGVRLLRAASRRHRVADLLLGAPREHTTVLALTEASRRWPDLLPRVAVPPSPQLIDVMALRWALESLITRALVERERGSTPPRTLALLDEGPTHPYKVMALVGAGREPSQEAVDVLPLPDVLVHVVIGPEVLAGRLRSRRERRPDGPRELAWSSEDRLTEEAMRTIRVSALVAEAARRRGVPVIEVDGSLEPSMASDVVDEGIRDVMTRSLEG